MFWTLIQKELRAVIQSPKFAGSFAVCSVLILLSTYTGIKEYKASVSQHETATSLVEQNLRESTSWAGLTTKAYRPPDPMQVFVSGLTYDIGRWSSISGENGVKLQHSAYADDPIFAVFRFVDFAFVVMFVLSLMAIQFTYDGVNGEKESGTLKLVFSNAVPRAHYLLAKCAGSWLGLVFPLGIPILLSLLMVVIMGVPFTTAHWLKIGVLLSLSLLLFTFFIFMGLLTSVLLKRSSVSFLVALLAWVALVMIIPRAGVMAAGGAVRVPSVAELEAQRDAFANERWTTFFNNLSAGVYGSACSKEEENIFDSVQTAIEAEIEEYDARLREDFRQRRIAQENAAWALSRISPVSAYQLASMALAGTDTESKARNEDAMADYRRRFLQYVEGKKAEAGQSDGIKIAVKADDKGITSMVVDASRSRSGLDINDLPRYGLALIGLAEEVAPTVLDFGILILDIFLVFMVGFIAFLRFDLR